MTGFLRDRGAVRCGPFTITGTEPASAEVKVSSSTRPVDRKSARG